MRRGTKGHRRQAARRDAGDAKGGGVPPHTEHFQICVHVIEARNLVWSFPLSGTSYVVMVYGKKKRRTTLRKNMVEPVYRESFVFDTCKTMHDLENSKIWMGVMETRMCSSPRLMGEGYIEIGEIWAQPNHHVDEKWIQLTLPTLPESVGFIKVCVIVIFKGDSEAIEMHTKTPGENDDNIHQASSSSEQQKANYKFKIFAALGLNAGDRRHGKSLNTFVKVSFSGLTAKTGVKHHDNNPQYCEQISMVEMFPNINQKVSFEVFTHEGVSTKILASSYLYLNWISHDGNNGFVPTFGPSLLHMYGALNNQPDIEGPYHRGALLVSLNTIVPYDLQKFRSVNVEPIMPVKLETLWRWENFCIYCPILQMSMIDGWLEGRCGVSITIGEMFNHYGEEKNDEAEFMAMLSEIRSRKLNYLEQDLTKASCMCMDFSKGFPVLQLAAKLPDFRFRIYRNNILSRIVTDLNEKVEDIECRLNSLNCDYVKDISTMIKLTADDAAASTKVFLDAAESEELKGQPTELDEKQLALMKQELGNIRKKLCDISSSSTTSLVNNNIESKKYVKTTLMELRHMVNTMNGLINKNPHGWPDIIIWVIRGGGTIAYYRMSAADILFSPDAEQNGRHAGKVQTLYLKSLKCPKHQTACQKCMITKIELQLWMGLYKQYYAFEDCLPEGYKIKLRGYNIFLKAISMILECRVFIYNAKLTGVIDNNAKTNVFVRVHILNKICETVFHPKSSLLTWNQVLKTRFETYSTPDKIEMTPPEVTVDVLENPSQSKEYLIGRVNVLPVVDDRQSYEHAPKLRNYDLFCGKDHVGEILMSVQLLKIPEKVVNTTSYGNLDTQPQENCTKDFSKCINFYEVEVLPTNMLPQMETYKIDIKWWGLRELPVIKKPCVVLEINNLVIKSDVALDKKANCNFPHGHSSYTFEAPLSEPYCPPLSLRLYDCSTFGRTLFLGAHVVKNPNKFMIKWMPTSERDRLLKSKKFTSQTFQSATHVLYVTNNHQTQRDEFLEEIYADKNNPKNEKCFKWRKLIAKKEPKEEELSLLPIFDSDIKTREKPPEKKDWWQRYFASKIYPSELEKQPEFSKFRDWCFNLKFHYNIEKKPVHEKDSSDYCGSLKTGIAVYNWPPAGDTVAVNKDGVDLSKGYFSEYPPNDPAKFLIRVYVLKAFNIVLKDYTDKRGFSIMITVGKKKFKDRQKDTQPSSNPMFGEMYELTCTLPEDYLLTLSLYEGSEELIGTTTIDLEDRIYTKHKACVGLSPKYDLVGPSKWRDQRKPSEILEELCACHHIPPPAYSDKDTVTVNGVPYKKNKTSSGENASSSEDQENICLSILHEWHTLPVCGFRLVPEHVETRTLYRPDKPDISQGQLQMWIDIYPFDSNENIPPPMDITPPKIEEYELRIVVWDVQGLKITNWKRKSLDIYIKGFIGSSDLAQTTDVCYGVTSEASFNWRMIFHLYYQHSEKMLIIKDKGPYTEYEERMPPNFIIQVIDNNTDQILASSSLNLTNFPRGVKHFQQCTLKSEERKKVNLFLTRSMRSWWCLETTNERGKKSMMGAINLEMTLLPKEQAELLPVGFGRGPPSPLPDPQGRETNELCREYLCGQGSSIRRNGVILLAVVAVVLILYFCMDSPIPKCCQILEDIGIIGSDDDDDDDIDEMLRPVE
ncbi:fer-1-like protein 6 isoform X2 [Plodia interpunctella]|uniref:fer-1-like protein 6 isoform X2 n=1 Tax=Plodia interpunctella TaxID=58824 RepID=UPI002367A67C|nr:fer-1-like protein 6 isoform X2 [Plodia interpunctella]